MAYPRMLIMLLATLALTAEVSAQAYTWTDENGVKVFSQTPPPDAQGVTKVDLPPPPQVSPDEASQRLDEQRQQLEDWREDREIARERREREAAERATRERNCAAARQNLEYFTNFTSTRRRFQTADGQWVRMTPEERDRRMAESQAYIDQNCN